MLEILVEKLSVLGGDSVLLLTQVLCFGFSSLNFFTQGIISWMHSFLKIELSLGSNFEMQNHRNAKRDFLKRTL